MRQSIELSGLDTLMKAKRINQPGLPHAIALYDARHFHSVLIDEAEARELIEELKRLLDNNPSEIPTQSHDT